MMGIDPESMPSYRFIDTVRGKTISAVFIWELVIMELFIIGAEQYVKKNSNSFTASIVRLPEITVESLDIVQWADTRKILSGARIVSIFKRRGENRRGLQSSRDLFVAETVIEMLKKRIKFFPREQNIRLRKAGKERALRPMDTSFFSRSKKRVRQAVLQTSTDRLFWNENSPEFQRSFFGFIQILSNKATTSLQGSKLIAYLVHAMLLNFTKQYKMSLTFSNHMLVAFLPVETEKSDRMTDTDTGGLKNQYTGSPLPNRRP